jgi:hypothetical protein
MKYDKEEDNFKAFFNNDVLFDEFHSTMDAIFKSDKFIKEQSFTATDFLNQYRAMYSGGHFHKNNIKPYVNVYGDKFNKENKKNKLNYVLRGRKWELIRV